MLLPGARLSGLGDSDVYVAVGVGQVSTHPATRLEFIHCYTLNISIKLGERCQSLHSRSSLLSSYFFYFSMSCFIKTSTPDMKFLLNFLLVLAFT